MSLVSRIPRATDNAKRPTLREVSPEFKRLSDKAEQLRAEDNTISAELQVLLAKYEVGKATTDRQLRVARELAGEEAGTDPLNAGTKERIAAIAERRAEIALALDLLRLPLVNARMSASAIVQQHVAPAHSQLVANICEKLIELHKAHAAYFIFADCLNSEGVAWSALHPMQAHFLGDPKSPQSAIGRYLNEAAKHGFVPAATIPAKLREGGQ
jgi:hypothetical protein